MAAYMRDVENNTRDMTAQKIIDNKWKKPESSKPMENFNQMPSASLETIPRFKETTQRTMPVLIDPCDPRVQLNDVIARSKLKANVDNQAQAKVKSKSKGKGKKNQEDEGMKKPIQKLWYEALSPEGYTYYWHFETNESVWEPPEEGYMTFAEQEEEVKEQQLQQELLQQLENEEKVEKAQILEEQRANEAREKMKELRKTKIDRNNEEQDEDQAVNVAGFEVGDEERPYLRDYTMPDRSQPYGAWQTVRVIQKKPIDFQLPQKKQQIQLPVFTAVEPPPVQRVFKEKTITQIDTNDSDDDDTTKFKKRKFGNKNVRQRLNDD